MAEVAAAIAIGAAVVGAYGSVQSGKIQQKMYNIKGRQAKIAGDQQSLNERKKGIQVLEKISSYGATINARSAAGSVDAFSGTPLVFQRIGTQQGMEEFGVTRTNSEILETMGILQQIDNRQAGSLAAHQGRVAAIMQIGQAAASYAMIGGGGSGGTGGTGGPAISGQTATTVPSGYGTMGATVPSNIPAYPR